MSAKAYFAPHGLFLVTQIEAIEKYHTMMDFATTALFLQRVVKSWFVIDSNKHSGLKLHYLVKYEKEYMGLTSLASRGSLFSGPYFGIACMTTPFWLVLKNTEALVTDKSCINDRTGIKSSRSEIYCVNGG